IAGLESEGAQAGPMKLVGFKPPLALFQVPVAEVEVRGEGVVEDRQRPADNRAATNAAYLIGSWLARLHRRAMDVVEHEEIGDDNLLYVCRVAQRKHSRSHGKRSRRGVAVGDEHLIALQGVNLAGFYQVSAVGSIKPSEHVRQPYQDTLLLSQIHQSTCYLGFPLRTAERKRHRRLLGSKVHARKS